MTKALGASSAINPKAVQLMWLSAGHGLCTLAEYFLVLNSEIRLRIWQVTRILSGVPGLLYVTGKMLNLGASSHISKSVMLRSYYIKWSMFAFYQVGGLYQKKKILLTLIFFEICFIIFFGRIFFKVAKYSWFLIEVWK